MFALTHVRRDLHSRHHAVRVSDGVGERNALVTGSGARTGAGEASDGVAGVYAGMLIFGVVLVAMSASGSSGSRR